MKRYLGLYIVLSALIFLPSCKVLYPNLMFQQKDYQYFELSQKQIEEYIIQPDDILTINVFSRDGFRLIDVVGDNPATNNSIRNTQNSNIDYLVDPEGFARIPIIGDFYVKGYTQAELQRVLAEKLSSLFVDPYVVVKVNNRRAFVFKGGNARVITLNEAPTNLIEVIAKAGGLEDGVKAYNIKIIRGDYKNPEITMVDLSTIEGLRRGELIIQSNDIVYIERRRRAISDVFREVLPYISVFTTVAGLVTTIILLRNIGK